MAEEGRRRVPKAANGKLKTVRSKAENSKHNGELKTVGPKVENGKKNGKLTTNENGKKTKLKTVIKRQN